MSGEKGTIKCPKCGFENPDEFIFCNECGQKITVICPSCQTANPPASKFCGKCGNDLKKPSDLPATPLDLTQPHCAQQVAVAMPLTHLVNLTRAFSTGILDSSVITGLAYLAVFSLIFFPLALRKMHQRLIR
jgi:hypothetical protein